MPSQVTSGTQAATSTTEHSLTTQTAGANYVLVVDTTNMVDGDVLELRIKTKTLSGSTARLAYFATYAHAQAEPNKFSVPVPSVHSIEATLKWTGASGPKNFDWSLVSL